MRCYDREFLFGQSLPKIDIFGKKSGHFQKNKKKQYCHLAIIKIHVLVKFHEEIMIFVEIRGHLVILSFYRAQTGYSKGCLRKRAIEF